MIAILGEESNQVPSKIRKESEKQLVTCVNFYLTTVLPMYFEKGEREINSGNWLIYKKKKEIRGYRNLDP